MRASPFEPWYREFTAPAYTVDRPAAKGVIRRVPEDFRVDELPAYEPRGEGVHAYLWIEKRDINTEQLGRRLAHCAGVRMMDVGYAGLKDRHAVTRQWFSVNLSGKQEPNWTQIEDARVRLLKVSRHDRKLRRGALRGNRFNIVVRDLSVPLQAIEPSLQRVGDAGAPNYFGEQRFGRAASNVARAAGFLAGRLRPRNRYERGLHLSVARSLLFNGVLSLRVADRTWNRALDGDVMVLDGRRGFFTVEAVDNGTLARLEAMAIHPTGPLWGVDGIRPCGAARELEERALAPFDGWCDGLERAGVAMDRRALRVRPGGLRWRALAADAVELSFSLPKGSYATSVLREVVSWQEDARSDQP